VRKGFHLSIAGGVRRAAEQALALGLDCLQIFAGNPRGWSQKPLDQEDVRRFKELCRRGGLDPVVVHAPYLINLASHKEELWQRSLRALAGQLVRARELGAVAVVVHPGSRGGRSAEWGRERVCQAVAAALREAGGGVQCWLENTAGGGGNLGGPLGELADMLRRLEDGPAAGAVGACLDTAHAWGAGYDLHSAGAAGRFLDQVEMELGLWRVKLWHFNDTSVELGSRRDVHCHLGRGRIGGQGFRGLACDPRLAQAACIMETPKDSPWADRRNLAFLRRLERNCA